MSTLQVASADQSSPLVQVLDALLREYGPNMSRMRIDAPRRELWRKARDVLDAHRLRTTTAGQTGAPAQSANVPQSEDESGDIFANVLSAMQDAEDIGGPEGEDYLDLMDRIATEASQRAANYCDTMGDAPCLQHTQGPLQSLLATVRPLVAMTNAEAAEKKLRGMRYMFCSCDALNPCWNNRADDVPGKHWGGGEACPECTLRATIASIRESGAT